MIFFSDIVETTAEPSDSRKSSRRSGRSTTSTTPSTPEAAKTVPTPTPSKADKSSLENVADKDAPNKTTDNVDASLEINEPKKSANAEKEKSSSREKEKSTVVKTPKVKSSKRLAAAVQQDKEESSQLAKAAPVDEIPKAKSNESSLNKSTEIADSNPNASNKNLDTDTGSSVPIIKSPLVIHHTLIMNDDKSSKASNEPSIDPTASPEKPRSNNPLRSIRKLRVAKGGDNENSNISVQSENTSSSSKPEESNKSFTNSKPQEDNKAPKDRTVEAKNTIKTDHKPNDSNKNDDTKIAGKSTTSRTEKSAETTETDKNILNQSMEETVENIGAFLAKTSNFTPNIDKSKEEAEKSINTTVSKESRENVDKKEVAEGTKAVKQTPGI